MVADVNIGTALNQQQNTANSSAALAEDFSEFLNLLTTQLQNQDPLSPMDTTEFTNQLVLFSGVEQQINSNQKLDSLVSLGISNGFTSALGYVGLDVSFLGNELFFEGRDTKVSYALEEEAFEAKINILDEQGDLVFSEDVSTAAGANEFIWDGTLNGGGIAPDGTYQVRIDALTFDGDPVQSSTVVSGRVHGVETQNGSLFALVGDRAVPISNILNANQPPEETEAQTEEPPAEEEEV